MSLARRLCASRAHHSPDLLPFLGTQRRKARLILCDRTASSGPGSRTVAQYSSCRPLGSFPSSMRNIAPTPAGFVKRTVGTRFCVQRAYIRSSLDVAV